MMLFYVVGIFFICSLLLFFWMRWRMKVSKGHFACAVVSALLTCSLTGASATFTNIHDIISSRLLQAAGLGPIAPIPSIFVWIPTALAMILIYRFEITTIKSWDAPPRVSETHLAIKKRENDLVALFFEQLKLILKRQKDHLASENATNPQIRVFEPPKPVAIKDLLKDMLISAYSEIYIREDGWRDDGNYWVGKKFGLVSEKKRLVIAFVCNGKPTHEELETRIMKLDEEESTDKADIFAIYLSKTADNSGTKPIQTSIRSVSILSSMDMILKGLNLRHYAQSLIETFENSRVGGTETTLKGSFVELKVTNSSNDGNPDVLSKQLQDWLSHNRGEHIALTGEYGQGKSTALLKFCYDWAKRFEEREVVDERVPLLIELRGQNPSETAPLNFLSPWCARYRLSPQQVLNLIKAGGAVIIFEGFDELKNAGSAYHRHQHFNALWRFSYSGTKLVFSGRPNFFLDQKEANHTLRSQETRELCGDSFTSIWCLEKLDLFQIRTACRSYGKKIKDGISVAAEKNPNFLDIISRPSMLPVVATIWEEIHDLSETNSPLTGATFIEKYIRAEFSRKEAELERDRVRDGTPIGTSYLVLPKLVREMLTVCVAWRMSGMKAKNTIARSEIVEMVRDLYEPLFSMSRTEGLAPSIAEGLIEFENRYVEESRADKIEAIAAEICSAGILVPDVVGGSTNLRFPHKQFFEFLISKGIAIKTSAPDLMATELLDKASKESGIVVRLRSEPNAVVFLVEIIDPDLNRILGFSERYFILCRCMIHILTECFFYGLGKTSRKLFLPLMKSVFLRC